MSIPPLPITLSPAPTPREAIADAIHRFTLGIDTNDLSTFTSAFTETAEFILRGETSKGIPAIKKACFDIVSKLDTLHMVSNMRINIAASGDKATLSAYALSQHFRPGTALLTGQQGLLAGSVYAAELVRAEEGLWRIERIVLEPKWADGCWDVITGVQSE